MKHITRHLQHYLPLFGVLIAGFIGFRLFSYDENFQAAVAVATAFGYVTWGIVHHHIHGDLHTSIVLEYAVIALLGVVIILTLVFRA